MHRCMCQAEVPNDKAARWFARDDARAVRPAGEGAVAAGEVDEMRHLFAVMTGKAVLLEKRLDVRFVAHRAGERFPHR